MGVDFIGAVIGFVLTIFVFSRTSTLKEYAKVRFTLSNTPQKKGIFSKFNHKREVKKENKFLVTKPQIPRLPNGVLLYMFTYLDNITLLMVIACLSKKMRNMLKSNDL